MGHDDGGVGRVGGEGGEELAVSCETQHALAVDREGRLLEDVKADEAEGLVGVADGSDDNVVVSRHQERRGEVLFLRARSDPIAVVVATDVKPMLLVARRCVVLTEEGETDLVKDRAVGVPLGGKLHWVVCPTELLSVGDISCVQNKARGVLGKRDVAKALEAVGGGVEPEVGDVRVGNLQNGEVGGGLEWW